MYNVEDKEDSSLHRDCQTVTELLMILVIGVQFSTYISAKQLQVIYTFNNPNITHAIITQGPLR